MFRKLYIAAVALLAPSKMRRLLQFAALGLALWLPGVANAATCFAITGGGSVTWNNSANWASSSGGSGGTCAATSGIPKNAGDVATLDGSSGGGTMTMDVAVPIATITMGAFTGTLNDGGQNVSLSTQLSCTGTATRSLTMTGTWTFTGTSGNVIDCTTMTNLTLTATSATWVFTATTASTRALLFGLAFSVGTVTVGANTSGGLWSLAGLSAATYTIGTFNVTAPNALAFSGSTTRIYAFTNGLSLTGSSTAQILFQAAAAATQPTLSSANAMTCTWCAFFHVAFAGGGNLTASNSFDLGNVTISGGGSKSITAPSSGGPRCIIGGWLLDPANDNRPMGLGALAQVGRQCPRG